MADYPLTGANFIQRAVNDKGLTKLLLLLVQSALVTFIFISNAL